MSASDTIRMRVDPGACMFITRIEATHEDGTVRLGIDSDCPHVKGLAAAVAETGLFDAISTPITENALFKKCSGHIVHAACPVPTALVKACEAAGGLCLRKDVHMVYE